MIRYFAILALLPLAGLPAGAQTTATHQHAAPPAAAATTSRPAPATPHVATAPFASAWRNYRRFDLNEPLTDWRAANDTVREIGGWQAYAKESARANAAPADKSGDRK